MRLFCGIFLLITTTVLAAPRKTVAEGRAGALYGFFTIQAMIAGRCEKLPGFKGIEVLRKKAEAKFKEQIDEARKTREGLYRRTRGENWREAMERANRAFAAGILRQINLSAGLCGEMLDDLTRQLALGWDYLGPSIEAQFQKTPPGLKGRLCEGV